MSKEGLQKVIQQEHGDCDKVIWLNCFTIFVHFAFDPKASLLRFFNSGEHLFNGRSTRSVYIPCGCEVSVSLLFKDKCCEHIRSISFVSYSKNALH